MGFSNNLFKVKILKMTKTILEKCIKILKNMKKFKSQLKNNKNYAHIYKNLTYKKIGIKCQVKIKLNSTIQIF